MRQAIRVSEESIRRHSKSFSLASRLLPARARDGAVAVYAWCRRADDAVDLAPPATQGTALHSLESELREVYAGGPLSDPILAAFQRTVVTYRMPIRYPSELLAGMEMDVRGQRYDSLDALLEYCHRVAGVVGLMMCHVIGVRDERALRNAAHLGIAMQLTNICRDVEEDWDRGRLYLPDDLLAVSGCPDLADRLGGPFPEAARTAVAAAISELLDQAERFYASGDAGMPELPWRSAWAIRTARHVYASIGRRIRTANCDPLAGRAFVPLRDKLLIVLGSFGMSLAEVPSRLARRGSSSIAPPRRVVAFPEDVLPTRWDER